MSKDDTPSSMIAPKPAPQGNLQPLQQLARERNMPATALAGMSRANGWAEGKQVTEEEFDAAMEAYRTRPMGGGAKTVQGS